jgi:peptidoglycan/LPS O-acetylase OafA/YrhL
VLSDRALIWPLGVGGTAVVGYLLVPAYSVANAVIYIGLGLLATVAIAAGVRRNRPARRMPWDLLAVGVGLASVGNVAWRTYLVGDPDVVGDPGPEWLNSLSDVFYLVSYAVLCVSMFLLIRGRRAGPDRTGLLDAAIISTGLALLAWTFLMRPIALDAELTVLQRLVMLAYPASDVLLIAMVARLLTTRGARTVSYALLVCGLILQLATDVG